MCVFSKKFLVEIFHCVNQKPFLLLHLVPGNCLLSSCCYPTDVIPSEECFDFGLESSGELICGLSVGGAEVFTLNIVTLF